MTRRRRNWLIGIAIFVIVVAVGAWVAYLRLLPWIVHREVNAAFASVGLTNVKFEVQHASLFGARLRGTGPDEQEVGIGAVSIDYSPWDALSGELKLIRVSNARLEIDLDQPLALVSPAPGDADAERGVSFDLPFQRLELERCALVLKRRDRELRLPIDGSIIRRATRAGNAEGAAADLTITSAIESTDLHVSGVIDGAAGSARITASSSNLNPRWLISLLPRDLAAGIDDVGGLVTFALDYRFADGESNAMLQVLLADVFVDAERGLGFSALGVSGAFTFDHLLVPSTAPDQSLTIARLDIGGQQLSDVVATFHLAGPQQLRIERLRTNWGGGVVRVAEPFVVDPGAPVIASTLVAQRVSLRPVVALLTAGRATGSGTVSGSIPFTLDLSDFDRPHVSIGEGVFRADAPGNLRLSEASEDFGELLARSDPTFDTDPIKIELRESVVEAMQDFDYDLLQVSVRRITDEFGQSDVYASMRLQGRGRTGGRLPLNLGVNVEGLEQAVNAYLAARSRVLPGMRFD